MSPGGGCLESARPKALKISSLPGGRIPTLHLTLISPHSFRTSGRRIFNFKGWPAMGCSMISMSGLCGEDLRNLRCCKRSARFAPTRKARGEKSSGIMMMAKTG